MTEIKTLVDHASIQSDRWLFLALLVIGLLSMWMLVKYFTCQIQTLSTKYDDLHKFVREDLSKMVSECTAALNANTRVVERLVNKTHE